MSELKKTIKELHEKYIEFSKDIVITKKEEKTFSAIDPIKSPKLLFLERTEISELVKRLEKTKKIKPINIFDFLITYSSYLDKIKTKHKVHLEEFEPFLPSKYAVKPWRKGGVKQNLRFYDRALFLSFSWSLGLAIFGGLIQLKDDPVPYFAFFIFLIIFPIAIWINFSKGGAAENEETKKEKWKNYKTSVIHYLQQTNLIYKFHSTRVHYEETITQGGGMVDVDIENIQRNREIDYGHKLLFEIDALLLTDKNETSPYLYPNSSFKEQLAKDMPGSHANVVGAKIFKIQELSEQLRDKSKM